MNKANPLVAAIDKERKHRQRVRRDNAQLRGLIALHEAAHAAVSYSYVPWGRIEIPFDNPLGAMSRDSCLSDDQEAETWFAGAAIDRVTFGHGLLAQGDFYPGLQILVRKYGHAAALAIGRVLMARAEQKVLALLPSIQALAVQAMPKDCLASGEFLRAARRAGLHSAGGRTRKTLASAFDLTQFATTPQQLRIDIGLDTLNIAHDRLWDEWSQRDPRIVRIPPCDCGPMINSAGCGAPLADEHSVNSALIDGWSKLMPVPATGPQFFWRKGFFDTALAAGR